MDQSKNNNGAPTKRTGTNNSINLDYDWNTEYGDGDIPDIDKPNNSVDDSKNNEENKHDDNSY